MIIANNDGRISQQEYDVIVSDAENKPLFYLKETGIDLAGLITSLRLIMEKSSPIGADTNGKGTIVDLEKEARLGRGAGIANAILMTKKPK